MDAYQFFWLKILTPIFFLYGLVEINRGWRILRYGESSLNPAIRIRVWIVKLFNGEKVATQYRKKIMNNTRQMKINGVYSILGGFIYLIGSIIWLLVLINVL